MENDSVPLQYKAGRQRFFLLYEFFNAFHALLVIHRFKMFSHGSVADGYAPVQHKIRFAQCERIPFDGVGILSPLNNKPLLQILEDGLIERTEPV